MEEIRPLVSEFLQYSKKQRDKESNEKLIINSKNAIVRLFKKPATMVGILVRVLIIVMIIVIAVVAIAWMTLLMAIAIIKLLFFILNTLMGLNRSSTKKHI